VETDGKQVEKEWGKMRKKIQEEDHEGTGKIEFNLELRKIFINCEIGAQSLTEFQLGFHTLELEGGPITVYINSLGGCLFTSLGIYNLLKNSKCEIHTIVTSVASSGAALIALAGSKRSAYRGSMFFIHEPIDEITGEFHKIRESYKGSKKCLDYIVDTLHRGTGKAKSSIRKDLLSNRWLMAEEAINYGTRGFIDKIIDEEE